jgi:hypothetical protein
MSQARWIVLILVSVAGVSAAGCGGGGSERVSAAELVQKADAICATENASFTRVQAHPPPNASVAADQTDELIKATQDANSHLRGLKPPEGLQAAYDRYLDARDRVIDQMNRGMDAARNQDSAEYGAAQAAVARGALQRMKLAEAVGLKVCSSSRVSA